MVGVCFVDGPDEVGREERRRWLYPQAGQLVEQIIHP